MHNVRRHLGSLGVFLALLAMWTLPALHAPCHEAHESHDACCTHCSTGHHDNHDSDAPVPQHNHDHDERNCGLCQLIAIAPYGGLPAQHPPPAVLFTPAIKPIHASSRLSDALRPLDVARGRGPPAYLNPL